MDASIVAIGLIVLHAFATAVLWFELRSHEKESKERIERLTASVLDAIGLLRQDLAAVLGPQGSDPSPRGGGHSPVSPGPTGDAPPKSTPRPVPMGQQTARAVKRWEKRVGELRDDATLASAEDVPTSNERTAAVPPAPGLPLRLVSVTRDDDPAHTRLTVVEGDDAAPATETPDQIRARLEAEEDRREQARACGEAGPLPTLDEDDARPTGELFGDDEQTRVHDASAVRNAVAKATGAPATQRPPPHKPPVPIKPSRPTLLGGITGAPAVPLNTRTAHRIDVLFWSKLALAAKDGAQTAHCEGPRCNGQIAVCDCLCARCDLRRALHAQATVEIVGPDTAGELAEHARDTITPTEPSAPTLDARIQRLWHHKIAAALEDGKNARHCYGAPCFHNSEAITACECNCDGCVLVGELLIAAHREITGRE